MTNDYRKDPKRGTVAFIVTPDYRETEAAEFEEFVLVELIRLTQLFNVVATGTTADEVHRLVDAVSIEDEQKILKIRRHLKAEIFSTQDLETQWKEPLGKGIQSLKPGYPGMIEATYDLILGKIEAVIHLMTWRDVTAKPDTMVLRRQANVHSIPLAFNFETATKIISGWASKCEELGEGERLFERVVPKNYHEVHDRLSGLTTDDDVLALIAHDGMKLEMCRLVVANRTKIMDYDYVLATGTTGGWIKRFLVAAGESASSVEEKVIPCLSGPYGGDVQIASVIVRGICDRVVFLQDPMASHPHEGDIRLFEQAVLASADGEYSEVRGGVPHSLATNVASAEGLLDARRSRRSGGT